MDEDELEVEKLTKVKKEINNLLWMYGDGDMTIDMAERRACNMLRIFEGKVLVV